jgi:hypothetical protein
MRITIGGSEVFSRSYRSYDELMEEYVDHMNERGRRVPDYDISILKYSAPRTCIMAFECSRPTAHQ